MGKNFFCLRGFVLFLILFGGLTGDISFADEAEWDADAIVEAFRRELGGDSWSYTRNREKPTPTGVEPPFAFGRYEISLPEHLIWMVNVVNNGLDGGRYTTMNCRVTADIDLSHIPNWRPIGGFDQPFCGTFDGGGHTIRGLTITKVTEHGTGLFGCVGRRVREEDTPASTIANLTLRDVAIDVDDGGGVMVGALVGSTHDTDISRCEVYGRVAGDRTVGGLVGSFWNGTIEHCIADVAVTARSSPGGLVGSLRYSAVKGSVVYGNVMAEDNDAGGLIGAAYKENFIGSSHAYGNVHGRGWCGGLVGCLDNPAIVYACSAAGDVTGIATLGGLVGINFGYVVSSTASGRVSGEAEIGGLVGFAYRGSNVRDSVATGEAVVVHLDD